MTAKSALENAAALAQTATPYRDAITRLHDQAREIAACAQPAMDALRADSATAVLSRQLADQFRAIDALKLDHYAGPPKIPAVRLPPNPVHETNRHLAGIEKKFERMEAIATESASIATSLQASAADFLAKFERAAGENNQTAKRTIFLGICALLIAVALTSGRHAIKKSLRC